MGVRISTCQLAVPPAIAKSFQLAACIGCSAEWIRQTTGVERRHVAHGDDDPADLAAAVVRHVIDETGAPAGVLLAARVFQWCDHYPKSSMSAIARVAGILELFQPAARRPPEPVQDPAVPAGGAV